ncbi:MAG: 16S rRNA (guanine(527)-N(7))-methyltransferase RsmG [Thermodesulfobacteriota bacterium]
MEIPVRESAVELMLRHLELVREWRARIDLTSVKSPSDLATLHFLDSLTIFKVLPIDVSLELLDVGSGGGFPGLVLAAVDATKQVTLMDRDPAKIVFLKLVTRELGLSNVRFLNVSLDTLVTRPKPPPFEAVVSRAFSSDPAILQRLSLVLSPEGHLVRMAGPSSLGEPFQIEGFREVRAWEGTLPFSDRFRRVILYERVSDTFPLF